VDNATRAGGPHSINGLKNKIAVLMGDYLLSRGLLLSLENDDFAFLKITSTAVRRMSEGELHQIQRSRKLDMDEPAYLRIIGDKTASLLSTCCEIGASNASAIPNTTASSGNTANRSGSHSRSAMTSWTTPDGRASRENRPDST
jgi:octaprenyl-diphosphate synthase